MRSLDIVESCHGVTYRKLDQWCHKGIFGEHAMAAERGSHRTFTEEDHRVACVLGPISLIFDEWSGGKGGPMPLYQALAVRVRAGDHTTTITLGTGVVVTIDIDLVTSMGRT